MKYTLILELHELYGHFKHALKGHYV